MMPNDPVTGGNILRRPAIRSPDYVTGVSGWTINSDGTAEFNNVDLRGTFQGNDWSINSGGFFFYNGTAALGTLAFAMAAIAGTDTYGNIYGQGYNVIGIADLTSAFSVLDTAGDTLAAIDTGGNITGQTVSAGVDVILGGDSLTGTLNGLAAGLVNYGYIATPFPSSGTFGSGETALFELDQVVTAGRIYEFKMYPTRIRGSADGQTIDLRLRFTTDGSTPTTSSTLATSVAGNIAASGGTMQHPGLSAPFFPTANGSYRFLVTGNTTGGNTYSFTVDPYIRCVVNDLGANDNGQGANNITVLGSGSGGGASKQTYTKTYSATHTYGYEGSTGHQPNTLFLTDSHVQQGGDYSNTYNGDSYSWILWPYSTIASDLSGATVNWVKIKLANQHTWYNSGGTCQLGWDTRSTFPSTTSQPSSLNNQVNKFFGEGQTLTFYVDSTGTTWGAQFKSGNAKSTLMAANTSDLHYYMYFAGHTAPQLIINYTK